MKTFVSWASLAVASVLTTGCGSARIPRPISVPAPRPAAPTPIVWSQGTQTSTNQILAVRYWFSPSQRDSLVEVRAVYGESYRPMFVRGVEYTECRGAAEPLMRWTDYVLVAETRDGPTCTEKTGKW